jgi:hypothetical protein
MDATEAILSLIEADGPKRTIAPSDAARAIDPENWRKHLSEIRSVAVKLALAGQIAIYRKGKIVDARSFKGVYRLGPVIPLE